MAAQIEPVQCFAETVAYQLQNGTIDDARMGRVVAMFKLRATRLWKYCALEAAQVFGGLAYTRNGVGGVVERSVREMLGAAIPGGSEEIMVDLSVKLSKL